MAAKKKEIEFRYYEIPQNEPCMALLDDGCKQSDNAYGGGEPDRRLCDGLWYADACRADLYPAYRSRILLLTECIRGRYYGRGQVTLAWSRADTWQVSRRKFAFVRLS